MCGLVGVAGKVNKDGKNAFDQMLLVCQLRGKDASGVIVIKDNDERDWFKAIGPSNVLLGSDKYDKMSAHWNKKIYIGHCRAATYGNSDDVENAHPFEHDHIVGVHNGTLDGTWRWKLDKGKEFGVDSSALMYNIAQNGAELTFGSVGGAWACVWWNTDENTLNFLRNKERPLYIAHTEDNKMMFWASEPWMLLIAERNGCKLKRDEQGRFATQLPIDELWSITVNANAKVDEKVFSAKIKKVEGEAPKKYEYPFAARGGDRGNFEKRGDFPFKKAEEKPPKTKVTLIHANPFEDDDIPEFMKPADNSETPPDTTKTPAESTSSDTPTTACPLGISGSTVLTDTKPSKTDSKKVVSSTKNSTLSLPPNNRKSTSGSSKPSGDNVLLLNTAQKPSVAKVIHRKIHGIGYVTDINGDEVEEAALWKKSGGTCCFCKQQINSVKDVAEVYDRGDAFLCVPCITEWDIQAFKNIGSGV